MNLAAHVTLAATLWPASVSIAAEVSHDAFVASAETSSTTGPFGILFVPRYQSLASAPDQRRQDLAALQALQTTWSPAERTAAAAALAARQDAVEHWIQQLERHSDDAPLSADRLGALLDQVDLLRVEAATLRAQREMVGEAVTEGAVPPTPDLSPSPDPADAVVIGSDLTVPAGQSVRDAVAFGGDIIVQGTVHRHATSFGGDIHIDDGGRVLGETTAFGGSVYPSASPVDAPPTTAALEVQSSVPTPLGMWASLAAWLLPLLTFAGAGVFTVGMVPQRVERVADMLEDRPVASLGMGMLGGFAILVGSLLFVLSIIGIPIALLLLTMLGMAWMLGFVAVCQAIGDRLPFDRPGLGRWTAFLVGAVLISVAGTLPWVGQIVLVLGSMVGVGAALATRLGGR